MPTPYFDLDIKVIAFAAVLVISFVVFHRSKQPLAPPSIHFLKTADVNIKSWRLKALHLPHTLQTAAIVLFLIALLNFHIAIPKSPNSKIPPHKGIALYMVLDQSGSMKEETIIKGHGGGERLISKVDLLKAVATQFIQGDAALHLKGRSNDMIGLIYFARGAKVISPLTLDHKSLLLKLKIFDAIKDKTQDGTSIGYAIFKATQMIKATHHFTDQGSDNRHPYQIQSNAIILITDGMQDPNPLDKGKRLRNLGVLEAAKIAKEEGVRVYIVNVEPKLLEERYAPVRHLMQRAALLTNGNFFTVDEDKDLVAVIKEIDGLEKSEFVQAFDLHRSSPFLFLDIATSWGLIALGLFLLSIAFILETFLIRRVP